MYQTILVPLDGSIRAESILPHVEDLAQCYRARVVFLRAVERFPAVAGQNTVYPVYEQTQFEQCLEEARAYLAARQGEFREKGIDARSRVVYGPVVDAILDAAESENADLIAMASHGRTGLPWVFYGSVAAGVLHRLDRPLLLSRSIDHG